MFPGAPNLDEIRSASRTTTGTLVTIPAGKWYTADVSLSASVAVAGTCAPTVQISGANGSDPDGTILARVTSTGLLTSASSVANTTEILVKAGVENDLDLTFTAGAAGASTVTCNGYVFG